MTQLPENIVNKINDENIIKEINTYTVVPAD